MALTTGISYIDWVVLSKESDDITLSLTEGTELIDINNVRTPRRRQIARVTPNDLGIKQQVHFQVEMTSGTVNIFTGKFGMDVACIALCGNNFYPSPSIDLTVDLYNTSGSIIASETIAGHNVYHNTKNLYFLLSQSYSSVFKVEVKILVSGAQIDYPLFELGRLWIGNYLEACFDSDHGFSHGSGAKESLSKGNDSYLHTKTPRKETPFNFSMIHDDDIYNTDASWHDFSEFVSTNRDLVIIPRLSGTDVHNQSAVYGKLKRPAQSNHDSGPYWDARLDVIQLV